MNKKIKIGGLITFAVVVILVVVTNIIHSASEKNIVELTEHIAYLEEEFTPMEFEISKYNDGDIKLKCVFYNMDGKKVGSKNVALNGNELNFDINVVKMDEDSFIFFPCGIYSEEMALADSIKIYDAYNDDGEPEIYEGITDIENDNGKKLSKKSKESIMEELKLYFALMISNESPNSTKEVHGVAVHDIKNVNSFKKGFVYKVVCHPHTGAVEIVRK